MTNVFLNRIATAVPKNDVHTAFVEYAEQMLCDGRHRALFRRMVLKSDVEHRFSPLQLTKATTADEADAHDVYIPGNFPSTAQRMKLFERFAPALAAKALDQLGLAEKERNRIRHVIVTCCTGLYAPGLDVSVMDHLRLAPSTERTMIGFMGCYAAINGLKQARHIVRSEPHPGGRSVLDAVQDGLGLCPEALRASRRVLSQCGNMSSASVMFVLHELMRKIQPGQRGCAISFGPGITAETMRFHAV